MGKENFFDFREKMARKPAGAAEPRGADAAAAALTVSQLTTQIDRALKSGLPSTVHVKGEVSNFNQHRASGHLYFTLKDPNACIDCVMFRSEAAKLKFIPDDGIELLVGGRIAVYPQRGRYQLYATSLHPLGHGALELAFKQLCERLRKEGLFAAERKKPLPQFPSRIAIITSQSTAALQDILKVLRRFPWLQLYLYHAPVQGEGAGARIADAIRHLNDQHEKAGGVDLILLARGGGSLEDLWAFNEEILARAMVDSSIPIITGIGHEVDTSIADLVADYHAHTPTEAAQVATTHWKLAGDLIHSAGVRLTRGLRGVVTESRHRLTQIHRHEFFRRPFDRINQMRQFLDDRQRSLLLAMSRRLQSASARVARFEAHLLECHPRHVIELKRQRLTNASERVKLVMDHQLKRQAQQLNALERHLHAISPQAVLQRGYSITTRKKDSAIVRSAGQVKPGERLFTRFADGTIESTVEDQKQLPLFE